MSRTELITRSRKLAAARDAIQAHGTNTDVWHSAIYSSRGRFADVLALGDRVLTSAPRSAYALTA
jgi:hypothetical protein